MPPGSSLLACFGGCFLQGGGARSKHDNQGSSAAARGTSSADCWQSVPDDVLQAMVSYLSPGDAALARLVCRHWRCILSCYTPALTIPTSFLAGKSAKAVLRSTAAYFPSLTCVNLHHTDGWCDPVQARMDVEPLVREERRNVSLEPLAAAFGHLQRLAVSDASFTRDPWSLQQLAWLPKLCSVSLAWDTGLWAPGQVLLEADALQPLFSMTQLTALQLDKHALLFLGEVPLGDAALTAAAHLRALLSLELSTVSASDQGVGALAALTALTRLSLRGQLAVSLGVLAKVLSSTTNLQELCLHGLLPCSKDLNRIAVAHGGKQQPHHSSTTSSSNSSRRRRHGSRHHCPSSSSSASPSSSLGSSFGSGSLGSSHRSSRAQSQQVQQDLEQQRGSGGSWRSSRLWQQQEQRTAAGSTDAATATSTSGRVQGPSSPAPDGSSATSSPGSSGSSGSSGSTLRGGVSSSSGRSSSRFRSLDWTVVFLPLRRLRRLDLQSDMVFLGSCAALRSMGHVTNICFHGAAKFLHHGAHLQPYAALPPSWLTSLAREASAAAVAAATAQHGGSSGGAARMLRAGGAWPGLVSLQVDNLQLADGFIQGVAQLANLRTVVVSGPCLLAAQQQLQQHGVGPFGSHHHHQQQQQQHHHLQQQQSASAPGWSSALSAKGAAAVSLLPDLSGFSDEGFSKPKALQEWATHKTADPQSAAAVLQAALASLKLGPGSSTSSSATTDSSTSTSSSGGSQALVPLMHASGMRPQLQPSVLAAIAAVQQQQQPARPVFRPVLDADVLTRLSPLSQLSKFELHLQQQLPCGLSMTPFALAHLSVSWTGLTSLSLNVPAPGLAAALGGADAVLQTTAGQLFASLGSLSPSLRHLSLLLTDGPSGLPEAAGTLGLPGAALPSTPEQPHTSGHLDIGEMLSSGGHVVAAASAVAALPWHLLPSNLESLSLSGFAGLKADNIKAVAEAAPQLKHLRLMYCQVPPAALWVLHHVLPLLTSLVVKEDALGGLGSSGVAAVAILEHLVSLAITLEQGADVAMLGQLGSLRYLVLDGRSNTDIRGIKGLMQLSRLKTLILPLLHLHHTNNTLLMTLQLALPHTHIMNVSRNLQQHHGCQWFKCFSAADREWWRQPPQPWDWHPTLQVLP